MSAQRVTRNNSYSIIEQNPTAGSEIQPGTSWSVRNNILYAVSSAYTKMYVSMSVFVFVLMGWSLLPNALRPFWDLLCSPKLDTRTWICRLNFAQGPIFSGLRFFNEPEISRRTCAQDVYVLKNSIDLSRIWIRKPWISRRAQYPEITKYNDDNEIIITYLLKIKPTCLEEFISQCSVEEKISMDQI